MAKSTRRRKFGYTRHDEEQFHDNDRIATDDERRPFERDRSRIIHSAAFRRLQRKTQVFSMGESDFFRTRLTHSLEVAQIGKGLALRAGADTDLVESICLIHDIGHPPFGHAGEDRLKELMRVYGGFEANAQNIRIITNLEVKSEKYEGLNLTRAVIDGQLKYKEAHSGRINQRKFIYSDDLYLIEWAGGEARNLIEGAETNWKSFECEIMDWADDIAYAVHDLEDSIRAGYIDASTFRKNNILDEIVYEISDKFKDENVNVRATVDSLMNDLLWKEYPHFRLLSDIPTEKLLKAHRKQLTSTLIGKYVKGVDRKKRGNPIKKLTRRDSKRYLYTLDIPVEHRVEVAFIKKLVMRFVIASPQIQMIEETAKTVIESLFTKFMERNNIEFLLPEDWKEQLPHNASMMERARTVCDYISGMTDDYAYKTYAKLFLPNQGSIYEVL